ncbi:PREDICTED: ceramide glucosyltransferase-B-like [Rhagoletis zephyria]|uniref:ceramide glucosyltransferase-B-like n=1 Tax=Rhagoletis zephyria TaxID=28612 RepID=UPI0008119617|nr:PREDICTED: ceramide glucosyltransferase-B-like [Rhagoletis zephyria]
MEHWFHRYILVAVAVCVIIGWSFVWIMHLIALFHGARTLHKKVDYDALKESPLPGVSIIKPLVGTDTNLKDNMESFFKLNYPKYEILFCVQDDQDHAKNYVNDLLVKYPHVDASLFVGGIKVGVNPKINNMQPAYLACKHELVLISDAGIRMEEDTLLDMVHSMKDDVALVHQMPFVCDRKGFPAVLEKVYFGTAHARIYLCADFLRINCPTGMSALMRKKLLDDVGGIASFGQYLAEDFFFAKSFTDRGWKLRISQQPAWQNSYTADIETFQNRITRWAKLRIAMIPHMILLEPLSECFVLGAMASCAISFLTQVDPFAVYLIHILLWFLFDYSLLIIIQKSNLPFSKIDFVIAWLLRELFALILFARALWEPDIRWRTGTYKLKWGGVAEEISEIKSKL